MIDLTINQPLLAGDAATRGEIAPGLLRVLRQAVGLRFALFALAAAIFVSGQSAGILPRFEATWLPWLLLAEAATFLGFVLWDRVRSVLGGRFLPVALGWFLVAALVEQAVVVLALPPQAPVRFGPDGLPGVGVEAIFLVVPVILATWQYGRKGLLAVLAALVFGHAVLAPLVSTDPLAVAIYLVGSLGRLAMIALLGYVVLQLVNGLRAEHQNLMAANRQLAQRAATAEQLAESRERNRLARELHDTLAHSLTGLSVQLQAVETLLQVDPPGAAVQLKKAQATVRSGIQESRRAIQALRASPLEALGLSEALRQLCRRQAERMDIGFVVEVADVEALDPLTEQAVYRVAEAALANVERHAAATHVRVTLARSQPAVRLRLEVSDDGIGFDPSTVHADRYGLTGMSEWAALAGGDLTVETKPGQGVLVVLEIPE